MKKGTAAPAATEKVVASAGDAALVLKEGVADQGDPQEAGERGPASSIETGEPGVTATAGPVTGEQEYAVQLHTADDGLTTKYVTAATGDEAASKVLAAHGYKGASIRGVTPASDPDANSLGGERDAGQMIANAENGGAVINTLGTAANAEAVEKLGKADVSELRD